MRHKVTVVVHGLKMFGVSNPVIPEGRSTNICAFSLLLHLESTDIRVCHLQQKMFVLATSTFLQVPVPIPAVQVPVQVPVLGMQVQVQVQVPENCT